MSDPPQLNQPRWPPSVVDRVDNVCDRFEEAWKSAESSAHRPRIEDYLEDTPEPERSALLHELIALEIEYRRRAGEHPSTEEYHVRFPPWTWHSSPVCSPPNDRQDLRRHRQTSRTAWSGQPPQR